MRLLTRCSESVCGNEGRNGLWLGEEWRGREGTWKGSQGSRTAAVRSLLAVHLDLHPGGRISLGIGLALSRPGRGTGRLTGPRHQAWAGLGLVYVLSVGAATAPFSRSGARRPSGAPCISDSLRARVRMRTRTRAPVSIRRWLQAVASVTFSAFSCSSLNKPCHSPKENLFYSEFSQHFFLKTIIGYLLKQLCGVTLAFWKPYNVGFS